MSGTEGQGGVPPPGPSAVIRTSDTNVLATTLANAVAAAMKENHRPSSAFKFNLPKIPQLGITLQWHEWLPMVEGQARCYQWDDMMVDSTKQVHDWPVAKQWLLQCIDPKDMFVVNSAACWIDAIAALKRAHTTSNEISNLKLTTELFEMKLLPSETAANLINRAKRVAENLRSNGAPVTPEQLKAAAIRALRINPQYNSIIETLLSIPGLPNTLDTIQDALSSVNTSIPGAFFSAEVPTKESCSL
jgi:gag-polypeptide of LTR copia-type